MAASSGKLYVGHVSTRTTRRDLEELFEKYGRVQNVEIKHGGFAFVDYEDSRDADEAVRELNGHSLNGDRLIVEHSKKAGGEGSGCFLCGGTGHWARDCPDANERDVRRHLTVEETMGINEAVGPDHLCNMKEAIHDHRPTTTAGNDPELHQDTGDHLALTITAEDGREAHEVMVAQGLPMIGNLCVEEARMEEVGIIRQKTGRHCRTI
ncbi:hypothetical protein INT44_008115 [Umbelopsis vinacea]|uniref:Uncharacterized protein n=1 Tax=Umbelopsis vinacea TaxID=44442 RepID=A0A8H7PP69_9FUNG|nr:hypothetical protein INT44_008115 [Umbelopsis vinacea]